MTHSCDSITSPCIKHLAIQVIRTKVTTGDCQLSSIATKTVSMHHNTVNTSHIGGLVSIHAPSRGATSPNTPPRRSTAFQFTPPLWGATSSFDSILRRIQFQFTCPSRSTTAFGDWLRAHWGVSIHVPLAEHDALPGTVDEAEPVSIHVPLAEHDVHESWPACQAAQFQFTCPSRSTTLCTYSGRRRTAVSIHVPLAEHDECPSVISSRRSRFNSRAPRGARPHSHFLHSITRGFQFTCPSRSTTQGEPQGGGSGWFQFTCPSRSTTRIKVRPAGQGRFNSRAPRGARPATTC